MVQTWLQYVPHGKTFSGVGNWPTTPNKDLAWTMPSENLPIFVYGTLKRGEEREPMWPRPAIKVERATTQGRLFDLGPYPALTEGTDTIDGELWHIAVDDLDVTLAALDEIECFGNDDVDLYVRRIVRCQTESGAIQKAYTYFLAAPNELADRSSIPPGQDGKCRWSAQSASE